MDLTTTSAFGGAGWRPRTQSMQQEIGAVWAICGIDSEWAPLRSVLLHRPGAELDVADPDAAQMLERPDTGLAAEQHDAMADAYRSAGVDVHYVQPVTAPPNLLFCADLFVMTPAGALLARPASTVRAGEERWVARRLADLGVPILRSIGGRGVFEGADLMWLDAATALVGLGLRTDAEGARQVTDALTELGVDVVMTTISRGAMHLMGQLRIVDRDLAFVRHGHVDDAAILALRNRGCEVHPFPDESEVMRTAANNFVVLGPRRILMPARNPASQRYYEGLGIDCTVIEVGELAKAAGAIGCMTGVVRRDVS
jgi:arginine deiminase